MLGVLFGLHLIIWVGIIGVIIYLIFRRINIHDKEDFEKRDN